MKTTKYLVILVLALAIAVPVMAKKQSDDLGGLYGDLFVIFRDEDGVPILTADGCIQPVDVNENVILFIIDEETGECVIADETQVDMLQTVDFGRLNLGRSPDDVLAHSFDEAVKAMNDAANKSGDISLDPAGRLVLTSGVDGLQKTIDSPLENLALYIKMMIDGDWIVPEEIVTLVDGGKPSDEEEERPVLSQEAADLLTDLGFPHLGNADSLPTDLTDPELILAASLLAAAADKSGDITLDMVVYLNSIYGINQVGTLEGETGTKTYYDFREFTYVRSDVYRERGTSSCDDGSVWVLALAEDGHWEEGCQVILGHVRFTGSEVPDNVGSFVQVADDALNVIEYIHNYNVPVILYP